MPKIVVPDSSEEKTLKVKQPERYRRFVMHGDKKVEVDTKEPSKEAIKSLGLRSKRTIVGEIAVNPPEIEKKIAMQKAEILRAIGMMRADERDEFLRKNAPIDFVPDKGNRVRYDISCVTCGDQIAYCYASHPDLRDWCDLHYICSHDKKTWYGCLAVNVSPIDGMLGFECSCGEDTRDFRANRDLPPMLKNLAIDYIMKHRGFNHSKARFIAIEHKTIKKEK